MHFSPLCWSKIEDPQWLRQTEDHPQAPVGREEGGCYLKPNWDFQTEGASSG